jgi:hypothetical protein
MKIFLTNLLKDYKKSYINNPENMNYSYNWNHSGFFKMEGNNVLSTTWGKGVYESINNYSVILKWRGFIHYTRFTPTYSNYYSIRLGDCEIATGSSNYMRDRLVNNQHIVIILTATVRVGNKIPLHQVDYKERLNTYLKSINSWLNNTLFKIVVVENSGYKFEEISSERLEIISYDENTLEEVKHLKNNCDKGSSELFAINYAYKHSKFIQSCKFIIKITGRFFIPELENYLTNYNLDSYDVLVQNNIKLDPRCEMVGCHKRIFDHVFSMNYNKTSISMVELLYRNRCLVYNNILECKRFSIEPTQRGGVNMIYNNI